MLQPGNIPDNATLAFNSSDPTKKLAISCAGITTGTTRTLTAPDASGTLALTSDLSAYGALAGTQSWTGVNTFRGNQASGLVIGNGGVLDFSQSTGPYFKGNASVGFRLNNADDSLNLWVVENNGDTKLYAGGSGIKARVHTSTGAFVTGSTSSGSNQLFSVSNATNMTAICGRSAASSTVTTLKNENSSGTAIHQFGDTTLGFFQSTPVAQQAAIADADGTLADITTKFNTLLSYLRPTKYGLIAA